MAICVAVVMLLAGGGVGDGGWRCLFQLRNVPRTCVRLRSCVRATALDGMFCKTITPIHGTCLFILALIPKGCVCFGAIC